MARECLGFNNDSVPESLKNVTKPVVVSTDHEFARFAEASRARWDAFGWLKVKIRQALNKKSPTK